MKRRETQPVYTPSATYRLQFNKSFTFDDAAGLVDYLNELGVTDIYASPFLMARPGSVHGYEYQWSWQYMLLISLVGCVLGWTKYKTQSTVASALMHSTFNLTQFAAFLVQQRSL